VAVSQSVLKRWVFIGSGQIHLMALKNLIKRVPAEVEIVVITDELETAVVSMFPAFIAGLYKSSEFFASVKEVIDELGGKLVHAQVLRIDSKNKKIKLSDKSEIEFDLLSVDCDAVIATDMMLGSVDHSHLMYPIREYQKAILNFCQGLRGKRKVDLAFIGCGVSAIECALAFRQRLKIYGSDVFVHMIEPISVETNSIHPDVNDEIKKHCEEIGFKFHKQVEIKEILATEIVLSALGSHEPQRIKTDFTSLACHFKAPEFLLKSGLDLLGKFISINHFLQSSNSHIFCVGDISKDPVKKWMMTQKQVRKQAKVLAINMRALSLQTKLKKYRSNPNDFKLMIDGAGGALAFKGSFFIKPSKFLWDLKDWVDQKFIASLRLSQKAEKMSLRPPTGPDNQKNDQTESKELTHA
jgi:NADH dehydrogenase FAD-containing subunit